MATTTKTAKTCKRCNGQGRLSSYSHIANGVCFGCNGSGDSANPRTYNPTAPARAAAPVYVELSAEEKARFAVPYAPPPPPPPFVPEPGVDYLALLLGDD
jgi:hypothetical protein